MSLEWNLSNIGLDFYQLWISLFIKRLKHFLTNIEKCVEVGRGYLKDVIFKERIQLVKYVKVFVNIKKLAVIKYNK